MSDELLKPPNQIKEEMKQSSTKYNSACDKTQDALYKVKQKEDELQKIQNRIDSVSKTKEQNKQNIDIQTQSITVTNEKLKLINDNLERSKQYNEDLVIQKYKLEQDDSPLAKKELLEIDKQIRESQKTIAQSYHLVRETKKHLSETKSILSNNERKEEAYDTALTEYNHELTDITDNYDECVTDYDKAKENEHNVKNKLITDYPNSFGELNNDFEESKKAVIAEKKVLFDITNKEQERLKTEELLTQIDNNLIEKITNESLKLDHLQQQLDLNTLDLNTKNKIDQKMSDINDKITSLATDASNKVATITNAAKAGKMDPSIHDAMYAGGDSLKFGLDGQMDKLITEHIQPKLKFAYMGEFPKILDKLNWLVKSMDKPKVDIETIEQTRNNVKRQYPVKYNFGDLSMTFWDDINHETITTLYEYFHDKVWTHNDVKLDGSFLLRDSIVIPKFYIYELTTNAGEGHLRYCFENSILSSFDFDNSEDESDDGIHTIQAVFKIERFTVEKMKSPSNINAFNIPIW